MDATEGDKKVEHVVVELGRELGTVWSVWITSTLNGSFSSTQSRNRMVLCWFSRS